MNAFEQAFFLFTETPVSEQKTFSSSSPLVAYSLIVVQLGTWLSDICVGITRETSFPFAVRELETVSYLGRTMDGGSG